MDKFPDLAEVMSLTLKALQKNNGSATNDEILEDVILIGKFSEEITNKIRPDGKTNCLNYEATWARTYLKKEGYVENSQRGVWTITSKGEKLDHKQMKAVVKAVVDADRLSRKGKSEQKPSDIEEIELKSSDWKSEILDILQSNDYTPAEFERLCQLVLRENGFNNVEVTGRSGDGGIDGTAILRLNLLSFQVLFQCKKYKGTVGSGAVRDFRGAMQGRTDKGLIITTGDFTQEARKEAKRDGAPAIELINGEAFCDLLKNLKLGVKVEMVEEITVNRDWFFRK
jgi:restriction system protein